MSGALLCCHSALPPTLRIDRVRLAFTQQQSAARRSTTALPLAYRWKYARVLWGYLLCSVVILKVIMPNYKAIVSNMSALEGKYK